MMGRRDDDGRKLVKDSEDLLKPYVADPAVSAMPCFGMGLISPEDLRRMEDPPQVVRGILPACHETKYSGST